MTSSIHQGHPGRRCVKAISCYLRATPLERPACQLAKTLSITLTEPCSEFERLPRKSMGKRVYELREKRRAADWVRGKANRLPL